MSSSSSCGLDAHKPVYAGVLPLFSLATLICPANIICVSRDWLFLSFLLCRELGFLSGSVKTDAYTATQLVSLFTLVTISHGELLTGEAETDC